MSTFAAFPPLQGAISQAESWTKYLQAHREEFDKREPDPRSTYLENVVWYGVQLGEAIPLTWRLTFENLVRTRKEMWTTTKDFEAGRQEVRKLFFTAREAMDSSRDLAEGQQRATGRKPEGMDRLLKAIDDVRQLEEVVFRDWPSFVEPLPTSEGSLPVDDSLAEALGISVQEARQKLDARKRERNSKKE